MSRTAWSSSVFATWPPARGVGLILLAGLAFALLAAPGMSAAKKPQKPVRVKLKVVTGGQAAVLDNGAVKVRVRSTGKTVVRLRGSNLQPKKVRFKRHRTVKRVVKLKVTGPGWTALSTCGDKTIRVNGRYRQKIRKRVIRRKNGRRVVRHRTIKRKRKATAKRVLNRDRSICAKPPSCDPVNGGACLLPWPNDHYTRKDTSTPTGLRLDLDDPMMPANRNGKHIEAAAWNRSDGFSPGQPILARVPGLDNPAAMAETDPPGITSIGDYLYPDAPVVLINAKTGERTPVWAELDSTAARDSERLLQIMPAASLEPGARYIVALRHLTDATGSVIRPSGEFLAFRDRKRVPADPDGARRARYERIFGELARADIPRDDLYLAWDFTVASEESLTGRLLSMRDDSFAGLGDHDLADRQVEGSSPAFSVDRVDHFTPAQNPRIAREIRGKLSVPCYLWPNCEMETGLDPGGTFRLDPKGLPEKNSGATMDAGYTCLIPRASETEAARPSLYGHGLFSSREEVTIRPHQNLAEDHNMVLCATDQIGLTAAEQGHVIGIVSDFSRFPEITDALQQGMLNELFLGRAMLHPDGFASNAAFRAGEDADGSPVIDVSANSRLSYSGYSMGGIMGGMLTAVAPDFDRAVLGVPGMRFSMLLPRSSYWNVFGALIKSAYRKDIETPIVLSLLQNLWDRGEANGYAHRMTSDPLPNTPPHEVLLNTAFGDHQVTNWATLVMARSVGARMRTPLLDPGRWTPGATWGLDAIAGWPYDGSAMTMWDIGPVRGDPPVGVPAPPTANEPNLAGQDPHDMIWDMPAERASVSEFVGPNAGFVDPCPAGTPCYAGDWSGPPSGP